MANIFVSHSSRDKRPFVRQLVTDLQAAGHSVWYDEWSIALGESIVQRIHDGIAECDYFVVVLSKNSIKSRWVAEELNAALVAAIESAKVVVAPIIYGQAKSIRVPNSLRGRKYIAFGSNNAAQYRLALQTLLSAFRGVRDIGNRLQPVFECPRCLNEDIKALPHMHVPTYQVVQWETSASSDWTYNKELKLAHVFFTVGKTSSRAALFKLDAEDERNLDSPRAKAHLWEGISGDDEQRRLVALQYTVGRRKVRSLYFINYAVERYLESLLRELTNDWDFDTKDRRAFRLHEAVPQRVAAVGSRAARSPRRRTQR